MAFLNVFLRTIGFLFAVAFFLALLNLISHYTYENSDEFVYIEGNKESKNIIAVLNLNGPIINNFNNNIESKIIEYIEPKLVEKKLLILQDINPKILIIKVNSPGGTVSATALLEKILNDYKKKNDVEVYFFTNEILASGGYWIATTGNMIFANYGSIIGSIGVSGPSWYYYNKPSSVSSGLFGQKIDTENGIEIYDQNAGKSKDLYNPFRKPTIKELKHLQNIVDNIYDDFLKKVSKSRKIEISYLKNDIGALIYTSNQAKDNYLIDDVLYFDGLLKKIIISKEFKDYKIIQSKFKKTFLGKYVSLYYEKNAHFICNEIKSNFVSLHPTFIKNC